MSRTENLGDPGSIAVVGMALRVPGATTLQRFWSNVLDGRDSLTRRSPSELRRDGVPWKAFLERDYVGSIPSIGNVGHFDAGFFGISGSEAEQIDPSHRLFLECAWEGMEDAGIVPGRLGPVTGVFAGCDGNYRQKVLEPKGGQVGDPAVTIPRRLGNALDFSTARVSHKLDLIGPSFTVMSACATSLLATHLAIRSLRRGECEVAIAGGATVEMSDFGGYQAGVEGMLSSSGRIRPFDAEADGTVFGNGVGVVVLRPLEDAIADGNAIYAVIRGSASTNDGNPPGKESFVAPSPEGQIAAVSKALKDSDVNPETIGYLEAHGTGTLLGDPVEVSSVSGVYRQYTDAVGYCSLGSVKANVGHLRCAAGVVSLIKTCIALNRRLLPPLANFHSPNPKIDIDSTPFCLHPEARPWRQPNYPRRAGVSAFGFGGTNVHVVLEEHRSSDESCSPGKRQLFVVSAKTAAALDRRVVDLGQHLETTRETSVAEVAYTLQTGRKALSHRACFYVDGDSFSPSKLFNTKPDASGVVEPSFRSLVFLFPGQGSQSPSMGADLYRSEPLYRDVVNECCEVLGPQLDIDLRELLGYGGGLLKDEDDALRLRRTDNAQPALFVVEYATARLVMSWGLTPSVMLGHSIGELVAACLAGVFSLSDGLKLVAARARLMQRCDPGSMAAVFMPLSDLQDKLPNQIEIAAANAPMINVVSGPTDAIEDFVERLEQEGVGAQRLETSHAFHSWMMDPVLPEFESIVGEIDLCRPRLPLISNITGRLLTEEQAVDPRYWADHIRRPVRFSEGLRSIGEFESPVFVELGPGSTLGDLLRHHDASLQTYATLAGRRDPSWDDARQVLTTLGEMWCAGVEVDWRAHHDGQQKKQVRLPSYPFQRFRYWHEETEGQGSGQTSKYPLYELGWKETPFDVDGVVKDQKPWLVFCDACGLGDAIVDRLREEGLRAVALKAGSSFAEIGRERFSIRPGSREDLVEVLSKTTEVFKGEPPRIVHLWSVTGSEGPHNSIEAFEQSNNTGFYTLVALIQAAFERSLAETLDVVAVVDGLAKVDGGEHRVHAEKAAMFGPCLNITFEAPGSSMRCVDVPLVDDQSALGWLVEAVLVESLRESESPFVALRHEKRFVEQFYELPALPTSRPRLREGGTVLITGGTGGLGLRFASQLFELSRARLILTARWAPPAETDWAGLSRKNDKIGRALRSVLELRSRGAEVSIVQADVSDRKSLERAVADCRARFGPIHGVVHAAGLIDPSPILTKTVESAERVFAPKVHGAFNLEAIFCDTPLDIFVYISSEASRRPEAGQVDYSAANAVLDCLSANRANKQRGLNCAVAWGPWEEVGIAVDSLRSDVPDAGPDAIVPAANDEPIDHPVFNTRAWQDDGGVLYRGQLLKGMWIVDEHIRQGVPLISGTTIIELVRAMYVDHIDKAYPIELRRVVLERPLFVDEGGTDIEVQFTPEGTYERFELRTRSDKRGVEWTVNATGLASPTCREPGLPRHSPTGDELPEFEEGIIFGPRWDCVLRTWSSDARSWARVRLPEQFLDDLKDYSLHPALLDTPTRLVCQYTRVPSVPHTWDAIRIYGSLGSEIEIQTEHYKAGSSDVFDAVYTDSAGTVLCEMEGGVKSEAEELDDNRPLQADRQASGAVAETGRPRRLVVTEPGDLESLRYEEFSMQPPGPDEVSIRVMASGLNFRDVLAALGQLPDVAAGPLVPGSECSGIVESVGENVHHLTPGDAVVALVHGSFCSHANVHAKRVAFMPDNLGFVRAAGVPIVFITAHYALNKVAGIESGERVLIHAATGGVGLAAVQLAQNAGAEIFATAGHPDKREYLKSMGVPHVMDSRSLEFAEEVMEITNGEGVDVVLNSLAGEFIPASLGLLRAHGRFLEIGKRDIYADTKLGLYPFRKNLSYNAIDLGKFIDELHPMLVNMFNDIMDQFASGELVPMPTSEVPVKRASEGFKRMAQARHMGKIVFQWHDETGPEVERERLFQEKYGDGAVTMEWGLDVFRRLLASDETPPYVLATRQPLQETGNVGTRAQTVSGGHRSRPDLDAGYQPPETDIERDLVALWEKTLGVSPIGVNDNFFDLGGDSIEAIQLQHFINRDFNLALKNTEFLENASVAGIVALIR